MATAFESKPRFLWTSESVTEGHPDKVCDQVSDAILDWCLSQSTSARVACESSVKSDQDTDYVWVYGEVTPLPPDEVVRGIVRRVLTDIGYTDRAFGTSAETAHIEVHLSDQSDEIAHSVDNSTEARQGDSPDIDFDSGAGDQGMMIGYACDETPEYMPAPIAYAHRLTHRLAEVRKNGSLHWLRPDGKSQVTAEYHYGKLARIDSVVISTQHAPEVSQKEIARQVREHVILPVIEPNLLDANTRFLINPTGSFVVGDPRGDAGLADRNGVTPLQHARSKGYTAMTSILEAAGAR